jgi:hypothetical protein
MSTRHRQALTRCTSIILIVFHSLKTPCLLRLEPSVALTRGRATAGPTKQGPALVVRSRALLDPRAGSSPGWAETHCGSGIALKPKAKVEPRARPKGRPQPYTQMRVSLFYAYSGPPTAPSQNHHPAPAATTRQLQRAARSHALRRMAASSPLKVASNS